MLGALAWLRAEAAARSAGWPRIAVFVSVVAMLVAFASIAVALLVARRAGLPPYALLVIMPVAMLLAISAGAGIVGALTARALAPAADLVRDAILRMRRCPSCGYALGVDASDGHEVVCAECGAAWAAGSLGRFGVAHAEAGEAMSIRQAIHAAAGHRSRRRDAAGRPYGSTLLAQRREPNQRWRDVLWARARRAEAIGIALLLGLFAAGIALALAAPGRAIAATSLVVLPSLGFVLFMVRLVRMRRMLDRLRLRVRRCLACESRLRPDGERLRCDACDAAWRRPERGRDTLRR